MGTPQQKKQLQQKSNLMVLITIVCVIGIAFATNVLGDSGMPVALCLMLVGAVTWIGGLMAYSQSKGYSSVLGLLSLLGLVGLLILLLLPDQWKLAAPPVVADPLSNYPRDPSRW